MKKRLLVLIMAFAVLLTAQATDKLSNATKRFLQERQLVIENPSDSAARRNVARRVSVVNNQEMISVFIGLNNKNLEELEAQGVIINSVFSNFVTAQIPVDKIEAIADLNIVKQIDVSQEMQLYTDNARSLTNVDDAIAGTGLKQAYDGRGVVAGIIDTGIDFNHAAFQDANGNTRIKRVYMPGSTGNSYGTTPKIDGYSLKGQEFDSTAISHLTYDTKSESHGTHTSSTVAGTNVNGYSGMAPKADIVICALGDTLSGVNIANSVKYIANYAKSVGKPCVISISLGSQGGPHDGTGYLCQAYNEAAGEGCIICVSSANSAQENIYFHKKFTGTSTTTPQCATIFDSDPSSLGSSYKCYSSVVAYSRDQKAFGVKFVVINTSTNSIVYTSNLINSESYIMGNSYNGYTDYYDSNFAKYFGGYVSVWTGTDEYSGKYEMSIYSLLQSPSSSSSSGGGSGRPGGSSSSTSSGSYKLGVLFFGEQGTEIDAWECGSYNEFAGSTSTIGGYTFTAGTDSVTVGTDACASGVISIGAYVSKANWKTLGNKTYTYNYTLNDVAPFSSYGIDIKGDTHPFITAPGSVLVAAFNTYCTSYASSSSSYAVYSKTNSTTSKTNYWGAMQGTSMACPTAAGIVALWLQKNPKLTPDQVKKIMKETAITDSYTEAGGIKFGNGKINALPYLQQSDTTPGDVNMDGNVDILDITTLVSKVLGENPDPFNGDAADLNDDGNYDVLDITALVSLILN